MIECDCTLVLGPEKPECASLNFSNFNLERDKVIEFLSGFPMTHTEYLSISDDLTKNDYSKPVICVNNYYLQNKGIIGLKVSLLTSFFSDCVGTYEDVKYLLDPEASAPLLYTDSRSVLFSELCKLLCKVNIRKLNTIYASD